MSDNLIYAYCPVYIIWELLFTITNTVMFNQRYFYCTMFSKIAHACTLAGDGECKMKLINIQDTEITLSDINSDKVLTNDECIEFFDNIMKYCLPNIVSCDPIGVNLGMYGQLDSFIIFELFGEMVKQYPILDTKDTEKFQDKIDMLFKLYFKFSESTKKLYDLTYIEDLIISPISDDNFEEIKTRLNQFEDLRIAQSGHQTVGDVYYGYDILFICYDLQKISFINPEVDDNPDNDTCDGIDPDSDECNNRKRRELFLQIQSSKLNGSTDVADIVNNLINNLTDPDFINTHSDENTPIGFFFLNFANGIEDINNNIIRIMTPENKYKTMFFLNLYSYSVIFINKYLFEAIEVPYCNTFKIQMLNFGVYNNNYSKDYPNSSVTLLGDAKDGILSFRNNIDVQNSISQTSRQIELNSIKALGGDITPFVDNASRLSIQGGEGLIPPLKDPPTQYKSAKGRAFDIVKAFGKGTASVIYSLGKGIVKIVAGAFVSVFVEIKVLVINLLKSFFEIGTGVKGEKFFEIKPGEFFNNIFRRLGLLIRAPFNAIKDVLTRNFGSEDPNPQTPDKKPLKPSKNTGTFRTLVAANARATAKGNTKLKGSGRAAKAAGPVMIILFAMGVYNLTQGMWDEYCEHANSVFMAQLHGKETAILMGQLVFGGSGPSCEPNKPPTDLRMNETNLAHLMSDDKNFKCVEVEQCKPTGDFYGSCNCKLFQQMQIRKDAQIKHSMYQNVLLDQKMSIIKDRNEQFTIVLFTIVLLIGILLITKYVLATRQLN